MDDTFRDIIQGIIIHTNHQVCLDKNTDLLIKCDDNAGHEKAHRKTNALKKRYFQNLLSLIF